MESIDLEKAKWNMNKEKLKWAQLFTDQGNLLYEGMTLDDKPCGPGTVYYSDGKIYQEGIFGIKGLTLGREYYPDGKLRFEGLYEVNIGYGPNYPKTGRGFSPDGQCLFDGKIIIKKSSLGYPLKNDLLGKVVQEGRPKYKWLMWNDLKDNSEKPNGVDQKKTQKDRL